MSTNLYVIPYSYSFSHIPEIFIINSLSLFILFGLIGYYKKYLKTPSEIDTITMFYKYNQFEYNNYTVSSHSIINHFYNFISL